MISQPYQVSDSISRDIRTEDTASDWLIANLPANRKRARLGLIRYLSFPNSTVSQAVKQVSDLMAEKASDWLVARFV